MNKIMAAVALMVIGCISYAQFVDIGAGLPAVSQASAVWGDYDNDGDLDVLINGHTVSAGDAPITKVYRNDGMDVFTDINADLAGIYGRNSEWGDVDNDGCLDILISGYSGSGSYTVKIYHNNGDGTFSDLFLDFPNYTLMRVYWADYDNDGDLDVLITGAIILTGVTQIFRNDGNGTFTDIDAVLPQLYLSAADWGDYDNDGDLDLALSGAEYYNSSYHGSTALLRNDGNDIFTDSGISFPTWYDGTIAWGDYDNDGSIDLLGSGGNTYQSSKLYRNAGQGAFYEIGVDFGNLAADSATWGDYDNDGDLDVLLAGGTSDITSISQIYRNDGDNVFTPYNANLLGVADGSVAWGDYDNDGKLDILVSGDYYTDGWNHQYLTKIYRNVGLYSNTAPNPPEGLNVFRDADYVYFSWDPASDAQTSAAGLTYNLRIGTTPGANDVFSANAHNDGLRKIAQLGDINGNRSWKADISSFDNNTGYYWGVQAIDNALAGSAFTPEHPFWISQAICLLANTNVNYGEVPIEEDSEIVEINLQNIGLDGLTITGLSSLDTQSQFHFNYPGLGLTLNPGDVDTIYVWFSPETVGSVSDTRYILSDAVNTPLVKVKLSGVGISVPLEAPQNLSILMNGNNANVSWDPVTMNTHQQPVEPDYYLVFLSADPCDEFTYHGATTGLQYSFPMTGVFQARMFYRVVAYKYYGRGVFDPVALGLVPGMPMEEVLKLLP